MIKVLEVSLGQVGALSLSNPSIIGVPVVEPGIILATGYYTEQITNQQYYYDAVADQWYYVTAAGYIYPLAISWRNSLSAKVDLSPGDTLRFNLTLKYMGPESIKTFYAAIGDNKTSGSFGEWLGYSTQQDITFLASTTPTIRNFNVDLLIPTGHQGEDGAAYCKIMNGFTLIEGINCTPYYYNVCHIVPVAGEFSEFGITSFVKVE